MEKIKNVLLTIFIVICCIVGFSIITTSILLYREDVAQDYCIEKGFDYSKMITIYNFNCYKEVPSPTGLGIEKVKSGLIKYEDIKWDLKK